MLYFYCRFRLSEIWVSTGVKVDPAHWDEKTKNFKKNCEKECEKIYGVILNKRKFEFHNAFYRLLAKESPITSESIRTEMGIVAPKAPHRKAPPVKTLSQEFKSYLKLREAVIAHHTFKKLNQLTAKLEGFEKKLKTRLTKDSFDRATFQEFVSFLLVDENLVDNTIAAHVSGLRGFLKFVNPTVNYDYIRYAEAYYNVFYLEEDEIKALKEAKNLLPYLEKTRDIFLIAYYTGVRYSDLRHIRMGNVNQNTMTLMMEKTNHYCYPPITNELTELLEKYGGACPHVSNQKLNDYLKILFRQLELKRKLVKMTKKGSEIIKETFELCDIISMHFARKTFIMSLVRQGFNLEDIMPMTGHSDVKSLGPYTTIVESRIKQIQNQIRVSKIL